MKETKSTWPTPECPPDAGIFASINQKENFEKLVNPKNCKIILDNENLFIKWILPNAILLYSKVWFDKVKRGGPISRSLPLPLFSHTEQPIESTLEGRARIIQIIHKTEHALRMYLQTEQENKSVGGYIVASIKNDIIKDLAKDNGYRLHHLGACPMCLSRGKKTVVQRHSEEQVSCDACREMAENIKLNVNKCMKENKHTEAGVLYSQYLSVCQFSLFSSTTSNCPQCSSRVPISCKVGNLIKCPFCRCSFVPSTAFGNDKRCLNKLPTISIWQNDDESLEEPDRNGCMLRDNLVEDVEQNLHNDILVSQKIQILLYEILIALANVSKNSVANITTHYFYLAVIKWMVKHPHDASSYFFDWQEVRRELSEKEKELHPNQIFKKQVNVVRGDSAIHHCIFSYWLDLLNNNMVKLNKLNPSIERVDDLGWFCREPKFSGGPTSTFLSVVDSNGFVNNETELRELNSNLKPRMAKIISVRKVGENTEYVGDIKSLEWHSFKLESLKEGDVVRVSALMMSGHPTHAPIQRILRLRSKTLQPAISRIIQEERQGDNFQDFWASRQKDVKEVYSEIIDEIRRVL